ncbi:MAG: hypothetical protein SA339_07110 [Methanomassiliicoccus sp.]|nr:hypothetical protein [Methanomassiliicoccus sp.]
MVIDVRLVVRWEIQKGMSMPNKIVIKGIDRTKVGTYLRWVDEKGLHHSTEHTLMLEYTVDGRYGLVQGDAETIKMVIERSGR